MAKYTAGRVDRLLDSDGFVGRIPEMTRLRAALDGAIAGTGRVAMLAGEPGAGKTRTAEELSMHASARGTTVLWARVHEEPGGPPYWPWVQVLRAYARPKPPGELRSELGENAAVLAGILPDLREKLPDLPEPESLGDAEADRFRLFEALTAFIKSASSRTPLLVVLDNLHWADESSLRLLEYVAHEIGDSRILLLGTFRDTELDRSHPLSRTLGDLTRERLFERVSLRGLSVAEVATLIERAAGTAPSAALAAIIHARTDGNALYVTELIRLLGQEGRLAPERLGEDARDERVPEGVRDVIGRRLDRLSRECGQVLATASVVGREFGVDLLTRLVEGTEASRLGEILDEARIAHIVEEIPNAAGRYRFTHKLVQETLETALGAGQRARLHARIVGALEALHGDGTEEHASEIAGHCAAAVAEMATAKLVLYTLAAAKRADAVGAWEDALALLERAIEAKGTAVMDRELALLYRQVPELLYVTGRPEQCLAMARKVFDYFAREKDVEGLLGTPMTLWNAAEFAPGGKSFPLGEYSRRALALLETASLPDPRTALSVSTFQWMADRDFGDISATLQAAVEAARRAEHGDAQTRLLDWWGFLAGAMQKLRVSLDLYGRCDDVSHEDRLAVSRLNRRMCGGECHLHLGDPDGARSRLGEAIRIADTIRSPRWRMARPLWELFVAQALGEWPAVRESVAAGLAVYGEPGPDVAEVFWFHGWGALMEHETGDAAAGDAHLERLVERLRDLDAPAVTAFIACSTSAIPRIARITGRERWLDLAAEASEQRLTRFHFGGVEALVNLGLVAVARGDVDEAGRIHDELLRVQEDSRAWFARSAGLMAFTAGDVDAALAHFDESYAFTRDAGYRPEHAWCCCDQADALLARSAAGDSARARSLLDEGRVLAAELGMKPLEARIASRLGRLSPARPAVYPDGLTEREVEVLRLVARGLTNKAIAFELSISTNTVATHLKHILEKTGCANRAEAVAYCLRRGVSSA